MNEVNTNIINKVDTDSGAYWESLSFAERRVAIQAITEWQEKVKIRMRLEVLKEEILNKMNEFDSLGDWQDTADLMEQLNDTYN